jgi:hypothetical protein
LALSNTEHVIAVDTRRTDSSRFAEPERAVQRTQINGFQRAVFGDSDFQVLRGDVRVIDHHIHVIAAPDPGRQLLEDMAADHIAMAAKLLDVG